MPNPPLVNPDADWDIIQNDYEAAVLTIRQLLVKHHITKSALEWRIAQQKWLMRRPQGAIDRRSLIGRLFKVLEGHIVKLEGDTMKTTNDKEVVMLGAITKNLEKLISLDAAEQPQRGRTGHTKDMKALRVKLAKRIDQLTSK